MQESTEQRRLEGIYEKLRLKLLDLSRKNRMLNYGFGARSRSHLQVVDGVLEDIYHKLVADEARLKVAFLPEPNNVPPEEKTEDFLAAMEHAKVSDIEYLTKLDALEREGRDDEFELARLDAELRDKVRTRLGLPPRLTRSEVNRSEHARSLGINPTLELPPNGRQGKPEALRIQSLKFPDELDRVMDRVARQARLAEQEMGISTLFLAFGFLEWYESDDSDKKAYAPLLLLPVKLESEKVRGKEVYYISAREGAAEANLSLQKLLEQNYKRELGNFDVDEEGASESIEEYFDLARSATDGLKRWNIRRWLVLGHFAFGRFAIYSDLRSENWNQPPTTHTLVSAILRGTERGPNDAPTLPSIPDDYLIDDPETEKIAPLLIQDADASQHSALIDVMRGKNLVIQGPPGTGKSQTIANIIANALADGRHVLFLSEKQAALDVVKRRLDMAGLGDFCLELHSDKASPKLVIESLKKRCVLGWGKPPRTERQSADVNVITRNESRSAIAKYLAGLHAERSDGTTPFTLMWKALRGRTQNQDVIETLKVLTVPRELLLDTSRVAALDARIGVFADVANSFMRTFGHPARSPWKKISLGEIPGYEIERVVSQLNELRGVGVGLGAFFDHYAGDLKIEAISSLGQLVEIDKALDEAPDAAPLAGLSGLDLDELALGLGEMHKLCDINESLSCKAELSHEEPRHLALAFRLIASGVPAGLTEMRPAEAYADAERSAEQVTRLVGLVEGCLPILSALSIGSDLPSNGAVAVAVAVSCACEVADEHVKWINTLLAIDQSAFEAALSNWRRLLGAESEWRDDLKANGSNSWPTANELSEAAGILRKTGVASLIASVNGSKKSANELAIRLGFLDVGKNLVEQLEGLAKHVEATIAFETNCDAAPLLGRLWHGMRTPFAELAEGARIRRDIQKQLASLPSGDRVARALINLETGKFAALTGFAKHANALRGDVDILKRLDERSIDTLLSELRRELVSLQKFLLVDSTRALSHIDVSILEISEISALLVKRTAALERLARSPLASTIDALGKSRRDIELAQRAIEWIRAVRGVVPPSPLREALVGPNATSVRQMVHEATLAGVEPYRAYTRLMGSLSSEFGISGLSTLLPNDLVDLLGLLITRRAELSDFLAIASHQRDLEEAGLGDLLARFDQIALPPDRLPGLFEALVAHGQADLVRRESVELRRLNGATLEAHRRAFAERDRAKITADRATVAMKLLEKVPLSGSDAGPKRTWTEMALLRNEFSKQKRFAPVRGLISRATNSIQVLKPCFMMSPLSLAKFAAPRQLKFDILVIDEASQMKPEEALGGLLRTKQIVVVGDAKQLPPTDFFTRSVDGANLDEDFEDIDDESILESCEKTFREVRSLRWHYRSRCESLIAFSNAEFYRNSLITFPMARPNSFSVDLVRVNGTYQARRNVAEAIRVAEEAIKFMREVSELSEETMPTIGMVSVNIDQRDLIQEELGRLSAGDTLVERYYEKAAKKGEPVFVKNLENVQGDERDFIFISLTYGPERESRVLKQRFGPINGKQGHRRLNVLFSRARIRIALFASFGSADVRPVETSADGPRVLKRYLEYAETRGRAIVEGIGTEPDSDFEVEVGERLGARGYHCDFQVGVSGYKIDLGVRHPDHPERFIAGIECDGARYHSSKSARDRDRLREEVLRGLGWDIFRVWSTDWFDNPETETEKLVGKLEQLRSGPPRVFHTYSIADPLAEASSSFSETDASGDQGNGAPIGQPVAEMKERSQSLDDSSARSAKVGMPNSNEATLTVGQAMKVLEDFRETVIRSEMIDWEPHRSILRDGMIETFIVQRITDPEDWFQRVPQFQRSGTNPVEKRLFLTRICEIMERVVEEEAVAKEYKESAAVKPSSLGEGELPVQIVLPTISSVSDPVPSAKALPSPDRYMVADFANFPVAPRADQFYEPGYKDVIEQMASYVIENEGPLYDDLLVTRIARAHGFQRAGAAIQNAVLSVVDRRFPRTKEDGRQVLWPVGMLVGVPVPYRRGPEEVRSHSNVPIAELASLALPFVRLRMDNEQVLRKLAEYFNLGRLREVTRKRFEKAVEFAHAAIKPDRETS